MNKRIKELAEQAGYKPLPGFDFANSLEEVFIKKFAQLIVKECARAADEGMAQVTMRVEWPSYHIKKHFGVEE
jgi:hypothetical protein